MRKIESIMRKRRGVRERERGKRLIIPHNTLSHSCSLPHNTLSHSRNAHALCSYVCVFVFVCVYEGERRGKSEREYYEEERRGVCV